MANLSLFDIIGPIMVGPSSSHTAGAAKIGKYASNFIHGKLKKVTFFLYGSFAKTYRGHGTNKALLGGVLGYDASSEELLRAEKIAEEREVSFEYILGEKEDVHPNYVEIWMEDTEGYVTTVSGESIGGGAVRIRSINGIDTDLDGELTAIITHHLDRVGILTEISSFLSSRGVNIATVNLYRASRGRSAYMALEVDGDIDPEVTEELKGSINDLIDVFVIEV